MLNKTSQLIIFRTSIFNPQFSHSKVPKVIRGRFCSLLVNVNECHQQGLSAKATYNKTVPLLIKCIYTINCGYSYQLCKYESSKYLPFNCTFTQSTLPIPINCTFTYQLCKYLSTLPSLINCTFTHILYLSCS